MASNYELTKVRTFGTGATRNQDAAKPDYEGFISPWVVKRYGEYMNKNRVQPDGSTRASDNWQLGIPLDAYMKSGFRHFHDWWMEHRDGVANEPLEEALCALIFNASGYLHELLKTKGYARHAATQQAGIEAGEETPAGDYRPGSCGNPHCHLCGINAQ